MDSVAINILSNDLEYSLALGEALSLYENRFLVTVQKTPWSFKDRNGDELFLIDADEETLEKEKEIQHIPKKQLIQLVESRRDEVKDLDVPVFKLCKYNRVGSLAGDILLYDSLLTGRTRMNIRDETCKMIAICSGAGGVGKTSITMGLGQAVCRYLGKKVLYVSLEEIESTSLYMECKQEQPSIGEYLYMLFKKGKTSLSQEGFLVWNIHGVHAFRPDRGRNRLRELEKEQMASFFRVAASEGGYDCILIDFGESLDSVSAWVLQQCTKVVTIWKADGGNGKRKRRFDEYIRFLMGKRADDDLIQVQNMFCGEEEEITASGMDGEEGIQVFNQVRIDLDKESFGYEQGIFTVSIDQDFGMGIRVLMRKII